jgi:3-hydroxyacyl-[acyl-carrier-protein] dehydratase
MARLFGLDRVISLEPGKSARALSNVPNTLAIFDTHFPRKPVLPGVLILECMRQLAVVLLKNQTNVSWRLAGVEQLRFRHFVQPGDQMELTVELKTFTADEAVLSGAVRVNAQVMVSARQLRLVPQAAGDAG